MPSPSRHPRLHGPDGRSRAASPGLVLGVLIGGLVAVGYGIYLLIAP